MGIEYEWKFRATRQVQKLVQQEVAAAWKEISMETTYYDTPDGFLSKHHYTLRQRMENGTSVCTVKTPAENGGRGEWETEDNDILHAIPALCRLGAPENLLLTIADLRPICGARFSRQAGTIDLGGTVVELALDKGILTGGAKEIPLCEIEVEYKSGNLAAAASFAMLLQKKYGLVPEEKSKFRRALDLTTEK